MSEPSPPGGGEGYGARDDEATPPRWLSCSWCNIPDEKASATYGRGFFVAMGRRPRHGQRNGAGYPCITVAAVLYYT